MSSFGQDKKAHSIKVPRLYKVAAGVLSDFRNGKHKPNFAILCKSTIFLESVTVLRKEPILTTVILTIDFDKILTTCGNCSTTANKNTIALKIHLINGRLHFDLSFYFSFLTLCLLL